MNKLKYYQDYFEAIFWADVEENEDIKNGNELTFEDIDEKCLIKQFKQLDAFFDQAESILEDTDYTHEQACHDFYFTRCHHGVGFWENDHCNEKQGEKLTEIAQSFGEIFIYMGDDGKLYID